MTELGVAEATLERLLAELGGAATRVQIVNVAKTRTRYRVHGCVAELTEVIADGKTVRTVAIEDADPAKVDRGRPGHGARPASRTSTTRVD